MEDDKTDPAPPPKSGALELEDDVEFAQLDDDKTDPAPPPKSGALELEDDVEYM